MGNFFTIREVLKKYDPEVVRYFILASHYRSPLNHSDEALDNAKAALTRFYIALNGLSVASALANTEYESRFSAAMEDDFNTPVAVAVLFDLARDINSLKTTNAAGAAALAATLRRLGGILGLLQGDPIAYLQGSKVEGKLREGSSVNDNIHTLSNEEIENQIMARLAARHAKNFAESDRIRDDLKAQGVILEDKPGGKTQWRRT